MSHLAAERRADYIKTTVDLRDIKAIIDLMKKNAVSEFEMEREGFKIRLKRSANGGVEEHSALPYSAGHLPIALPGPTPAPSVPTVREVEIRSPMIGTLYRSPSPEAAPYADVGSEVGPDTVVCIIEAMKVMNEIKAETKGVITEVLVENAKTVEYGTVLFKVRPT